MTKLLVALAVIAAGAIAENSPEVPVGETFEAPDGVATGLIEASQAKLFVEVPKEKIVKARVLVDCEHGKAGDVAKLPTTVAQAAQNAGQVDTHASAVAYAERQIRLAQQKAEDAAALS
jgi:hypothetical protein